MGDFVGFVAEVDEKLAAYLAAGLQFLGQLFVRGVVQRATESVGHRVGVSVSHLRSSFSVRPIKARVVARVAGSA